jgi:DNA-binding IclR family transcriptional regulator
MIYTEVKAMGQSRKLILAALSDYKPKSQREIVKATGIGGSAAYNALAALIYPEF